MDATFWDPLARELQAWANEELRLGSRPKAGRIFRVAERKQLQADRRRRAYDRWHTPYSEMSEL